MVEKAQQMVAGMEIGNVAIIKARLQDGYASEAYDAIIIEGAVNLCRKHCWISWQMGPIGSYLASRGRTGRRGLYLAQNRQGGFQNSPIYRTGTCTG